MNHSEDLGTLTALAALELLEAEERAAFAELLARDPATRASLAGFQQAAAALTLAMPAQSPSLTLRARLLKRVAEEVKAAEAQVTLAPGLTLTFGNRIPWTAPAIPGVRIKRLFVDPARRYASSLVTMRAGTVYPAHRHTQVEELFMLSGDLIVGGHVIRAGDYCRAEPATLHEAVRTEHGCTFIALASLDDEMLDASV